MRRDKGAAVARRGEVVDAARRSSGGGAVLTRVRHDRNRRAALEKAEDLRDRAREVVVVMRDEPLALNPKVAQQAGGHAGVLRGDHIALAQGTHRPQRDVLEIADGRANIICGERKNMVASRM